MSLKMIVSPITNSKKDTPLLLSLCAAANSVISNGSGIGWTTPFPSHSELLPYFQTQAESPHCILLVAHTNDRTKALGSLQLCHTLNNPRGEASRFRAEVSCFFVSPSAHNQGVGRLLLTSAENMARDMGFEKLQLDVRATQLPAIRLYKRCGYVMWATSEFYARTRDGRTHRGFYMHKHLSGKGARLRYVPHLLATRVESLGFVDPSPALHMISSSKPTIVMLHGFPDNYRSFDMMAKFFRARGYNVITPHLPGYIVPVAGHASVPQRHSDFRLDNICDRLQTYLELHRQHDQPLHLIGHDWGSLVAQRSFARNPDSFATCTLLSVPLDYVSLLFSSFGREQIQKVWYIILINLPLAEVFFINNYGIRKLFESWSPTWDQSARDKRVSSVESSMSSRYVASSAFEYYRQNIGLGSSIFRLLLVLIFPLLPVLPFILSLVKPPSYILRMIPVDLRCEDIPRSRRSRILQIGGADDGCCHRCLFEHADKLTNSKIIPGAGHWLHLEKPDIIHDLIINHINKKHD